MADKYIKGLSENTNPDGTDAIEIDDGTNSEYVALNNMFNGAPTTGDTIYFNGTKWVRRTAGTAGYVYTSGGAGVAPDWAAGGGSSKIEGALINGKISVTVSANDLIVALKTWADADPSAGDPVKVYIAGNERTITSALSVTVADGANSFNAGSAELATKAIDYFVYLSWRAASSAVVIGFSRIPFARLYSDFSSTATNEKYGAFSTAPASTDDVVNIGRFEATLSAGAGYTWTVPTFTSANLKQSPTFESRWLTYVPAWSGLSSMTVTGVTVSHAKYKVRTGNDVELDVVSSAFTIGGTPSSLIYMTLPFSSSQSDFPLISGGVPITDAGGAEMGFLRCDSTVTRAAWARRTGNNYTSGAGTFLAAHGEYSI